MSFKIGDKVMEIATGDIGIIDSEIYKNAHYVKWETGDRSGETLWLDDNELQLVSRSIDEKDLSGEKIVIAGVTYILMRNADNV